ncbi:MAG: Tfx family DNA-binding protein [Thaumarchaeota archaeon]|nr:Tfx family DNA-binding protein [Nitrososphaerota archaeon]
MTSRQWEVLKLRSAGFTQHETAIRLHTSRENISIIESRAYKKIRAAKATLAALNNLALKNEVLLPTGTDLFEAVRMIMTRADIVGTKLRLTADDILSTFRSKCRGRIRGHHITAVVKVLVEEDGSIVIR